MAAPTFACPACGSRKTLARTLPGETIHCTCGMSYPVSPLFAVADDPGPTRKKGRGWVVAVVLIVGAGGVGAWLFSRLDAAPDTTGSQAASQPQEVSPQPKDPMVLQSKAEETPATGATPPSAPTVSVSPPEKGTTTDVPPVPMAAPAPGPADPGPERQAVASLSAVTLWDAFDLDPPAATARFAGKLVEVTAVGRVDRDSLDQPYFGAVVVKPASRLARRLNALEWQWEKGGYPPSVRCYLTPEQAEALEMQPPVRPIILRGTCIGRKDIDNPPVYRGYIVELVDCTVVAPK
jgi:hypothetical protein